MKKLWMFLNGRKTIICLLVITFLQSSFGENLLSPDLSDFLLTIFTILGGGSLAHHIKKSIKKKKVD